MNNYEGTYPEAEGTYDPESPYQRPVTGRPCPSCRGEGVQWRDRAKQITMDCPTCSGSGNLASPNDYYRRPNR